MRSGRQRVFIACSYHLQSLGIYALCDRTNLVNRVVIVQVQRPMTSNPQEYTGAKLEPGNVYLRHLHQIHRVRSARDEGVNGLDSSGGVDRLGWLLLLQGLPVMLVLTKNASYEPPYLVSLSLACHDLSALDDRINIRCDVQTEAGVDWWNSATVVLMQPRHHFVAGEQAQLLLQLALHRNVRKSRLTTKGRRYLRLCEAPGDGHDATCKNPLSQNGAKQMLEVGRKTEWHGVWGGEHRVGSGAP